MKEGLDTGQLLSGTEAIVLQAKRDAESSLTNFIRKQVHVPRREARAIVTNLLSAEASPLNGRTPLAPPSTPAQTSTATATTKTPFQPIAGPSGAVGIYYYSAIFKSLKVTDDLAITGLLTSASPADDDAGWFDCPAIGEKIWVQIGTSDPDDDDHVLQPWAGTTQIMHGTVGGDVFAEYDDPVNINTDDPDNHYQEAYNLLIAEIVDPDTDGRPGITMTIGSGDSAEKRKVVQMFSQNVTLVRWAVGNNVLLVPLNPTLDFVATPV